MFTRAVPDRWGDTPLHLACYCGHMGCARKLIAAGADPKKPSRDGKTAIETAKRKGHLELAAMLTAVPPVPTADVGLDLTYGVVIEGRLLVRRGAEKAFTERYAVYSRLYSALFFWVGTREKAAGAVRKLRLEQLKHVRHLKSTLDGRRFDVVTPTFVVEFAADTMEVASRWCLGLTDAIAEGPMPALEGPAADLSVAQRRVMGSGVVSMRGLSPSMGGMGYSSMSSMASPGLNSAVSTPTMSELSSPAHSHRSAFGNKGAHTPSRPAQGNGHPGRHAVVAGGDAEEALDAVRRALEKDKQDRLKQLHEEALARQEQLRREHDAEIARAEAEAAAELKRHKEESERRLAARRAELEAHHRSHAEERLGAHAELDHHTKEKAKREYEAERDQLLERLSVERQRQQEALTAKLARREAKRIRAAHQKFELELRHTAEEEEAAARAVEEQFDRNLHAATSFPDLVMAAAMSVRWRGESRASSRPPTIDEGEP